MTQTSRPSPSAFSSFSLTLSNSFQSFTLLHLLALHPIANHHVRIGAVTCVVRVCCVRVLLIQHSHLLVFRG